MPNYGCYIFIENQIERSGQGIPLVLTQSDAVYGNWSLPPPPTIAYGEKVRIELADTLGPTGSEGVIEYRSQLQIFPGPYPTVSLKFACPTALPPKNWVEVDAKWDSSRSWLQTTYYAKSGSDVQEPIEQGHWGAANDCPWFGHPLAIWLVLKYNPNM